MRETMEAIAIIIVLAVLVEALIEAVKGIVPEEANAPAWLWPIVCAGVGVALCLLAQADFLVQVGVDLRAPAAGQVATGILISRGSNFLHDLWARVNGQRGQ